MLTEKLFDTGEVVINFAEGDTHGPPLVMLHGATLNWQTMGPLIPTLAQNWKIYACDFRGHGKSGRATSGYRVVDYAPDVTAFIERVIGRPAVLLGWSMGAAVAIQVAARLPRLTRALVSLDPGLMLWSTSIKSFTRVYASTTQAYDILTSSRTTEEMVVNIQRHMPGIDAAGIQFNVDRISGLDPEMLACLLNDRVVDGFDLEPVLRQVACPTLFVYGESELGAMVRASDAALFQANVPQAKIVHIKEVGHDILWGPAGALTLEHITQFLVSV